MKASELLFEYQDPAGDEEMIRHKEDTRRPRLTLRHLNKLRKVREIRQLELGKRARDIPSIYTPPPEPSM